MNAALRVLALAGALACAGCAQAPAPTDVLMMARVKDAVGLDPSTVTDGISLNTTNLIFQNLVTFAPGSFELTGDAARRWWVSRDGKTYTFELWPGLLFSDGTPLDARAVKYNLDRWRLPSDPAHGSYPYSYYSDDFGGYPGLVRDVRVLSPTRVAIVLAHPFGPFLRDIAEQAFGLGSPRAIAADEKGFQVNPVGSGPYMLAEWQRDDHITLVVNPRYRGPKPAYGTVIVRDIPDQATSMLAMQHGDVDILEGPRPDDAKQLAAQPGITVAEQPSNNVSYLAMNLERRPFGDLRVRRAVAYALDVRLMAGSLYAAGASAASNWTPPGMLGENPALQVYPHDPGRAKALLAQAGLPSGFAVKLMYSTAPRPYLPEPQRVAETIAAQLAQAGIRVTLEPFEWGVYLDNIKHGRHEMCLIGWTGDNGDPDNFLYPLLDQDSAHADGTAQNYSFWRDAAFHRLMLAGQATSDERRRTDIYRQANAMVHDQVPAVPLVHTTVPIVLRSTLTGFVPSPNTSYHLELVRPARSQRP